MSLDADLIVDRRRMRRKLTFWRVLAVLVAIAAVVALAATAKRGDVLTFHYDNGDTKSYSHSQASSDVASETVMRG